MCNFEHRSRLLFLVKLTYTDKEILTDLNFSSLLQGIAGKKKDVGWAHACKDDWWYTDSTTAPHAALHPLLQLSAQRCYPHPAEDGRGARLQGLCQGNSKLASRLVCHLHFSVADISQRPYSKRFILPFWGKNTKCVCICVLQRLAMDPRCKGMPLSSFLLKPMQRVTRYPLIIKNVSAHTASGSQRT